MDHFQRKQGILCAEDVSFETLAQAYQTPTYVYSQSTLTRHVQVLQAGLSQFKHLICYAVKANANLAVLELLHQLGCGFDAVSVGELARVLHAGVPANRVILSGVGKRDDEIAAALDAGVLYLGVESAEELAAVARIAQHKNKQAPVAMRVNPDVDAKTHPYISTGLKTNKFGVPFQEAERLYREGASNSYLKMCAITCHIGSQITTLDPFIDAAQRLRLLVVSLQEQGIPLEHVGMGGGLGVPYQNETPPSPQEYGQALANILGSTQLSLVLEPGRVIVGNAGVLLTRVVRIKKSQDKTFVIVDAGMNDLLRPALYQAHHTLEVVSPRVGALETVDVVGPVCESSDVFAKHIALPPLQEGDLIILRTAGAYGSVMASTYNGRPLPAEVLVSQAHHQCIRARASLSDLWRHEFHLNTQPALNPFNREK